MERFKHVVPTKEYETQAIDYIREFQEYHSAINGTGGLQRYLDDYDGWLVKLEKDRNQIPNEERVPAETYFLVREEDDRIVGMINIRLALNENLRNLGGHIGYSIRPTERGKGYNKINLYLGLCCLKEHGIEEALLDCDKENVASSKTMQALGAKLKREYYHEQEKCMVQDYTINVLEALETYQESYQRYLSQRKKGI